MIINEINIDDIIIISNIYYVVVFLYNIVIDYESAHLQFILKTLSVKQHSVGVVSGESIHGRVVINNVLLWVNAVFGQAKVVE